MEDIQKGGKDGTFKKLRSQNSFTKNIVLILPIVFLFGLFIRLNELPIDLVLTADALEYFFYASDVNFNNQLPINYTPINNGWPIFISFFMSLFTFDSTLSYMNLQRMLSLVLSAITIFPIFFLCKKYLGNFYGIIGAVIFAVEPRLIQNSVMGITEPLFILLSVTGFVLFLSFKKYLVYFSFIIVSIASMIRGEGVLLLIAMFLLFVIKSKKNISIIPKSILIITIVFLIMLPMSTYRIDVIDRDGMFMRFSNTSTNVVFEKTINPQSNYFKNGIENFPKYLGWDLIPIFIIFVPIGGIILVKRRNFEMLSVIIPSFLISLSAAHAYSIPLLDTRYFYPLYPFFIILTVFAIKYFVDRTNNKKIAYAILVSIILSSVIFLIVKPIDYEREYEIQSISEKILLNSKNINNYLPESRYLESVDLPEKWMNFQNLLNESRIESISTRQSMDHSFNLFSMNNEKHVDEFISKNKEIGLEHLIVDSNFNRPHFIKDIHLNENKFSYLEKIYDSKEEGFNYHVKIFKINYEEFLNE